MSIDIIDPMKCGVKNTPPFLSKFDSGYLYTRIDFYVAGEDLFVKLSGRYMPTRWNRVSHFKQYTALEVMAFVDWGRHWEDGIQELYHKLDIDLGYTYKLLRPLVVKK